MSKKKWYKRNWIWATYSALLGLIFSIIRDLWTKEKILTSFSDFFSFIWNSILKYEIPVWVILTVIVSSFFLIIIIDRFTSKNDKNENPYPKFYYYTNDIIKGWNWSWHWVKVWGKFQINDLAPHCPKCETKLKYIQYSFSQPHVRCPRCLYRGPIEGKEDIERIIHDNIERGLIKTTKLLT